MMNKAQQNRFNSLHQDHVNALIRQGKAQRTIDGYSRAVRRTTEFYDQCPDRLTLKQLNDYFLALVKAILGAPSRSTTIRTDVPTRACFGCPTCHGKMTIINVTRKKWIPG